MVTASVPLGDDRFADHRVLVVTDVGSAGSAEVEHQRRIGSPPAPAQITRDDGPDVLGKRNTELRRLPASAPLQLRFETDLSLSHHDGYIILH